jgi:hypothetical protein
MIAKILRRVSKVFPKKEVKIRKRENEILAMLLKHIANML